MRKLKKVFENRLNDSTSPIGVRNNNNNDLVFSHTPVGSNCKISIKLSLMTKHFWVCFLVSWTLLILTSCKQTVKPKPDKVVLQNKDTCYSGNMEPISPPPPEKFVISTDSIFHKEDNKSQLFTVSLISDKTVDIEGKHIQIFHIKAKNQDKSESYDFALPTKYNKYWGEFHIYKNIKTKTFDIGFENTDSNFVHLMYSIYLDTLPFNKGLIRVDFKEQKLKLKDKML